MKKIFSLILVFTCIMALTGCMQSEPISDEKRKITAEEIEEINTAFEAIIPLEHEEYDSMLNPIIHFFTSYYEKPQDMNFGEFLMYFGTEDLDIDGIPFLGEPYNAFYNHTSDAGFPVFTCNGGEIDGDIITLYSKHHTLTLHKENENYFIYSYLKNE